MLFRQYETKMSASMSNPNVEVRFIDSMKGKGLYARRSFKSGEDLFEEKPLVCAQFLWNQLYKYLACEYCLKSLENAEEQSRRLTNNLSITLPYLQCCEVQQDQHVVCQQCQVKYCCKECQDRAWQEYHKTLCMGPSKDDAEHPLNRLQEAWRNMHYPPETSSIMMIVKILAMIKQAEDKSAVMGLFSQFVKTTVNEEEQIVHKLLGKQFQEQLDIMLQLTREALYDDDIQQWLTPEGFRSLFALIGTNGQGIGSSSISVWVKNCEKLQLPSEEKEQLDKYIDQLYEELDRVSGTFLDCEGSGLYNLQSACNHSCVPNAEITFPYNNHVMVLKAVQDIAEDEEICISYLDECDKDRSRHSRQKILRENYLFICNCVKCISEADDPDVTSEEDEDDDDEEDGDMDDES